MASFSVVSNVSSANLQSGTSVRALSRVSSGYRITSSGDDAGGLIAANQARDTVTLSAGARSSAAAAATASSVVTSLPSQDAQQSSSGNSARSQVLKRSASGYRISSSGDDGGGLKQALQQSGLLQAWRDSGQQ